MKKFIENFKLWNEWRKNCLNGRAHNLFVLLGIIVSPTFENYKSIKNLEQDGIKWENLKNTDTNS